MRTFEIGTDPQGAGRRVYRKKSHTFEPGLTVLAGCNGAGKTTLLKEAEYRLRRERIPVLSYNNLKEGRDGTGRCLFQGDMAGVAARMSSSEGENIMLNVCTLAEGLREFVHTGETEQNPFVNIFAEKQGPVKTKERWILLDAVDSGFSVDNVAELKDFLHMVLEDAEAQGMEAYILVSANEYELCAGEHCYDVQGCRYTEFASYDEYRDFILETRKKKDKSCQRKDG